LPSGLVVGQLEVDPICRTLGGRGRYDEWPRADTTVRADADRRRGLGERTCPHCGNVERRAFGESVSERGELASYAIGWTSGHEDQVAHMTIGLGAGSPRGGSFDIEIRMGEDAWRVTLVDRPFERVPQGRPDLTREQALAHEDLDYVWFVADQVMAQDRRAFWMLHWLVGTQALVHRTGPGRADIGPTSRP
jgi:hypothetical protein